ncbi:hypothetical protein [Catenulispora pinisilvae]|uniref:hypothetical protein n=1 Tax=Catenulispora pinisilvae TaxID=2705253 RepID=UPI001891353D|nr:hypothetical protein [Catenulispora pinisilvae]
MLAGLVEVGKRELAGVVEVGKRELAAAGFAAAYEVAEQARSAQEAMARAE